MGMSLAAYRSADHPERVIRGEVFRRPTYEFIAVYVGGLATSTDADRVLVVTRRGGALDLNIDRTYTLSTLRHPNGEHGWITVPVQMSSGPVTRVEISLCGCRPDGGDGEVLVPAMGVMDLPGVLEAGR